MGPGLFAGLFLAAAPAPVLADPPPPAPIAIPAPDPVPDAPEPAPAPVVPAIDAPDIGQAGAESLTPVHRMPARQAVALLGQPVRVKDGTEVGHVIDLLVDRSGRPRAAVLDCGGFLGVGNRRVAVDWGTLRFVPDAADQFIVTDLSADDVRAAPEYKDADQPEILTHASRPPEPREADGPPAPPAAAGGAGDTGRGTGRSGDAGGGVAVSAPPAPNRAAQPR